MKNLFLVLSLPLLLTGCVVGRYSSKVSDKGTNNTFTIAAAFHKDSLKGLVVNSSTQNSKTGLKLQSAEGTSDAESLKALGDLIGRAAGIAAKTAMVP